MECTDEVKQQHGKEEPEEMGEHEEDDPLAAGNGRPKCPDVINSVTTVAE